MAIALVFLIFVNKISPIPMGMPPNIGHPTHIIVNIHGHNIPIGLGDPLRRLRSKQHSFFPHLLPLTDRQLRILHLHLTHDVSHGIDMSADVEAADEEVQDVVDKLFLRAVTVEVEADTGVHPEAEVVGESFEQVGAGGLSLLVYHYNQVVDVFLFHDVAFVFVG
jgi:hypothetical protein